MSGNLVRGLMVVLLAGAMAAACGSDGGGDDESLSPKDYFVATQTIVSDAGARFAQLVDDRVAVSEQTLDLSSRKAAGSAYVEGYAEIVDDTHDQLAALHPPSDLKEAHDRFVKAHSAFQPVADDAKAAVADADSGDELEDAFRVFGADFETANVGFAEACIALQQLARDSSIRVDLKCL